MTFKVGAGPDSFFAGDVRVGFNGVPMEPGVDFVVEDGLLVFTEIGSRKLAAVRISCAPLKCVDCRWCTRYVSRYYCRAFGKWVRETCTACAPRRPYPERSPYDRFEPRIEDADDGSR